MRPQRLLSKQFKRVRALSSYSYADKSSPVQIAVLTICIYCVDGYRHAYTTILHPRPENGSSMFRLSLYPLTRLFIITTWNTTN